MKTCEDHSVDAVVVYDSNLYKCPFCQLLRENEDLESKLEERTEERNEARVDLALAQNQIEALEDEKGKS